MNHQSQNTRMTKIVNIEMKVIPNLNIKISEMNKNLLKK